VFVIQASAATQAVVDALARAGVPAPGPIGAALRFLLATVVIYLVGRLIAVPAVDRALSRRGVEAQARPPIHRLVKVLVGFVAVGVAFCVAGYGNFLTSLATIAAAATLAIGFALQDTIKNLVAGIFLFVDRPFRVGDWIEFDTYAGVAEDLSFRVSRVRTFDNELLTGPNSTLTGGAIKNPVAKDKLRIKCLFGIDYEDVEQATDLIL